MADKDVEITGSGMTITVKVFFPSTRDYNPKDSVVTAQRVVNGEPIGAQIVLISEQIRGGAKFDHTVTESGDYKVDVECSGKTFGDTLTLPAGRSIGAFFRYSPTKIRSANP